jgi:uncharacterized membrane protein YidH (DUF202 family)
MSSTSTVSNSSEKWLERFARIGLTAKGVVYCISGILAFMAAFHLGNATERDAGRKGTFKVIAEQPFGMVLIAIVALGLALYCIWRFIQAIKDTEEKGSDAKGLAKRAVYLSSGVVYAGVVIYAIKFLLDIKQKSNGSKQQQVTKEILQSSTGEWLLYVVALLIAAVGVYQLYFSLSGKYKKHIQQRRLPPNTSKVLLNTGKAGYIARGIVWLIIGWLFFKAGLSQNANAAVGSDDAFRWLKTSSYGSILLGIVALGLICYGIFMFVRARYQPIGQRL